MPYGDWVGPIEYDAPEAAQDVTTENATPATDDTPGADWMAFFGVLLIVGGVLLIAYGGIVGIVLGAILYAGSKPAAQAEAHMREETQRTGDGCGAFVVAVLTGLLVFALAFAVLFGLMGGGL